ncbi:hypothetical protein OOU_Y34scaffold00203g71 [Pyricularia oryzae Y34]|uniref:Uncharacterized protein n=2 Tax=Pyricularia oryzae TaxID=318829 RepID=A0AA97P6I7_PYRO3|nr:hypothetical protein OOU_Y34scaffold00203g71 [Pyricularia oryzae Y34]
MRRVNQKDNDRRPPYVVHEEAELILGVDRQYCVPKESG